LTVEVKSDGSPVTIADRSAEDSARAWIASRFPEDGVLGEEMGLDRPEAPRRWIVDPIDGTKTFVRGVPLWGTLVAVCEGESILAGAAYFPALDEMLSAAPRLGCWWNGKRCNVSATRMLNEATVLTTDERFAGDASQRAAWQRLSDAASVSRTWGDCYGYLLVATGRAEVMVDGRMSPWDSAAILPAIVEAGGSFTDWSGKPTAFGTNAIATNAALAAPVRSILGVPS
jgi:histidinol phosphatase-like enzyme (inositol monophosphatase family)